MGREKIGMHSPWCFAGTFNEISCIILRSSPGEKYLYKPKIFKLCPRLTLVRRQRGVFNLKFVCPTSRPGDYAGSF